MSDNENTNQPDALSAADRFYGAVGTTRDQVGLLEALHGDFVIRLSPGLPIPGPREHRGREAAAANVWGRLPVDFALRCEPDRKVLVAEDEVFVLGHYRGDGWEAPFLHVLTVQDGKIASLRQITDTRCWPGSPAAELAETRD